MDDARAALARRFARHGESLDSSPMYRDLMLRCAADIERGGPVWDVMRGHEGPPGSVPALRLLGAVHRLVLAREAPALAPFYPSVGGRYDGAAAWPAFVALLPRTVPWLDRTVQTNEVGRAAALLGAFHLVSLTYGRPLRMLEVGASAGLLLRWDAFRYTGPGFAWGDERSPVRLDTFATSVPVDDGLAVAERRGCDVAPVDPATEEGRLLLQAYVWPDQADRLARLRAALSVAESVPAVVDKASAAAWTRDRLAERTDAVPVVYHSIVMQYLAADERAAFEAEVRDADGPRAWVRFEPEDADFVVRVATWPGGEDRLVARSHPHGYDVEWLTT